jgi:hypothetical protein
VNKAPRNVTLLDELIDQMFAFPARDRAQFLEYDVSKENEGLVDCIEWTFRGLENSRAASTEAVHVARTAGPSLHTHQNNINIKKKTITELTRLTG